MYFVFFSCLTALARISGAILYKSGESGHLYLVAYPSGKNIQSFTFEYKSVLIFFCRCSLSNWRILPLFQFFWVFFFIINRYSFLSHVFFFTKWYNHLIFLLYFVNMVEYIDWLWLEPALHFYNKPHCVEFFVCITIYQYFVRVLHLYSWETLVSIFLFLVLYLLLVSE